MLKKDFPVLLTTWKGRVVHLAMHTQHFWKEKKNAMDVEKTSKIWRNPWRTENSELRIFAHLESTEAESQVPYSVYRKTVAQGNSEKTSVTFNLE